MTASYQCKNCGLVFVAGWLHFHNDEKNKPESITFIVCVECGRNYYILHGENIIEESIYAMGESFDSGIDITNVLERVLEKRGEKINAAFPLTLHDPSPATAGQHNDNFVMRLLQKIFRAKAEHLCKSYNLGKIRCLGCNQEKRLVAEYPFGTLCPKCMHNALDSFSFMT